MNKYIRLPAIIVIIVAITLICLLFANMPSDIVSYLSIDGEVIIYCNSCTTEAISDGVALQLVTNTSNFSRDCASCSGIMGYSITASNTDNNLAKVMCDSQVMCEQTIDDITLYYCHNPNVLGGVVIDGDIINMQVAVSDDRIVVGSPLILGSY